MLKGLALTPPVIGRIAIGKMVERNGKRLPEKDDEFTVTSQIQSKDGWIPHPHNESLRKEPGQKLRSIPIRFLFDDPDLNFRVKYTMFDRQSGRPVCVGDGENCRRTTSAGMQSMPCPTPMGCAVGIAGHCKPYGRLHVRIGDEDELGSFVFRTTGFNSIRTLTTRMKYYQAVSGNRLASMKLELRLRGKSTTQSHRAPIYYVDITPASRATLENLVQEAVLTRNQQFAAGIDQGLLDEAARAGFALGEFEESEEEGAAVVEEFFSSEVVDAAESGAGATAVDTVSLAQKLQTRSHHRGGSGCIASSAVKT